MIEIAAILSIAIQHYEDFGIIVALLLLNAIVGFWEEHQAENAIELLKEKLALKATCYAMEGGQTSLQRALSPAILCGCVWVRSFRQMLSS